MHVEVTILAQSSSKVDIRKSICHFFVLFIDCVVASIVDWIIRVCLIRIIRDRVFGRHPASISSAAYEMFMFDLSCVRNLYVCSS